MSKSEKVFEIIKQNQLIGLLAPRSVEQCITAYETLNPLGVVLEIAIRTEAAIEGIKSVLKRYPEALILAGTVMLKKQAETVIKAGVAGIISADYIPEVVELSVKNNVMCIPGGLSDCGKQLVQKANILGCDLETLQEKYPFQWCYKLFPAATETGSNLGLCKALRGPFRNLTMLYTGGISLKNLAAAVSMDPAGIFCGSAVTKAVDAPAEMIAEAKKWLETIRSAKNI